MRRDVVIRIGDRNEVRHLAGVRPRIVHRRRPSAGSREVERGNDRVVPHEHLSRRRADREIRLRSLGANAPVHLRSRIGEEIEVLSGVQGRERVRPGGHRLGGVRRLVPPLRHLRRDDPAQVAVERQNVDRHHATRRSRLQYDIAAVACPAHLERLRARLEPQRRREVLVAEHEPAIEDDRTGRQMQLPALLVDDQERCRRPDAHVCLMGDQQHADRARRGNRDVRLRVVVGKDLAIPEPVPCVALSAPLAHADPVAPAPSVEQEHCAGRRRRGEREGDEHGCHSDPHGGSAE